MDISQIILECNGICHNDKAAYLKITCSGVYNNFPLKLKILKDGSVNKEYKNICHEPQHYATIAYNYNWLEINNESEMIEHPVEPITGLYSYIPYDYEILKSFFENYHIKPTWIDSNGTDGWFDEETGHWTGAVGKVIQIFQMITKTYHVTQKKLCSV